LHNVKVFCQDKAKKLAGKPKSVYIIRKRRMNAAGYLTFQGFFARFYLAFMRTAFMPRHLCGRHLCRRIARMGVLNFNQGEGLTGIPSKAKESLK